MEQRVSASVADLTDGEPLHAEKTLDLQAEPQRSSAKRRFTARFMAEKEKERRRSMQMLCSKLLSLVPSEYLAGKQSLAVYLEEAARYINFLKATVEEAEKKLMEIRSEAAVSSAEEILSINLNGESIDLRIQRVDAAHAVLFADGVKPGIPLSKLLEVVQCSGSSVVSLSALPMGNVNHITILAQVSEDFNAKTLCAAVANNCVNAGNRPVREFVDADGTSGFEF